MHPNHIREFFQRFAQNIHTEEEHRHFTDWLEQAPMIEVGDAAEQYQRLVENAAPSATSHTRLMTGIEQNLDRWEREQRRTIPLYKRSWLRVAAAVLIILGGGTLYWTLARHAATPDIAVAAKAPSADVMPGSDKAVLILGDGTEVKLEDAKNNTIIDKDGNRLSNNKGMLSYAGYSDNTKSVAHHTVKIPRKGQYHLLLSDGTQVWLNAESSITFPTVFVGGQRTVTITGEVYFEIAKNVASPFVVMAGDMETKVLGTHFNVNAYDNEAMTKVTLLEGSVEVNNGKHAERLAPGQQGRLDRRGFLTVHDDANLEEAIAWKSGVFEFDDTEIQSVMRQLARWYDVEVQYEGNVLQHISGTIPRSVPLSHVLDLLQKTGGLKYTVEGNRIIIKP